MKKVDHFLIFAQNIDRGYTLEPPQLEPVLTSNHNLWFRAKIRKICIPLVNPSFTISKWGVRGNKLHGRLCMMIQVDELSPIDHICINCWLPVYKKSILEKQEASKINGVV